MDRPVTGDCRPYPSEHFTTIEGLEVCTSAGKIGRIRQRLINVYLFTLIDFYAQHLLKSLSFGMTHRLHMLGIFQHFPRQAGILTIAL